MLTYSYCIYLGDMITNYFNILYYILSYSLFVSKMICITFVFKIFVSVVLL